MEARILSLPTPIPATPTAVRVDGERIVVERLVLADPALAASLAERDPDDLPALVERALRIGLLALQDAATSVDVDVVRREFEKLVAQATAVNEHATRAVEEVLRANFADGDGRLPRTLEHFLGDRGALRQFVNELFDETRRDSAIGRIGGLLGQYFDGDRSKVAQLLDPTRLGSPLHQFRQEISEGFAGLHERLAALEASSRARADERARSAAKGGDFEVLLHGMLGDLARGGGDLLDRTGTETGVAAGLQEGRLRPDAQHRRHARRRRAGRARGEGPRDVAAGDARGAARGAREPGRGRRRRRLDAAPRADRHRAVRPGRRRRPRGRRSRVAGRRLPRGGGAAGPAAGDLDARGARGGRRRGRDRSGAGRGARAARGHPRAQDAADLGLERDQGRVDGPRDA